MKIYTSLLLCFFLSLNLQAQQFITAPMNTSYNELLEKVFDGKWDKETGSIKWKATIADLYELSGTLGDGFLYTKLDTAFVYENSLYLVSHTSSYMKNSEGEIENTNSCHVCGTHISLIIFDIVDNTYSLSTVKKNMGQHGTFGEPNYILKLVDLGNSYILLQIDDGYSGMGITSINTTFYYYGLPVLNMISSEDNSGSFEPHQKGYYTFNTKFVFNKKNQTIKAIQTGYKMDEKTGKHIPTAKTKLWKFEGNSLQF
jgi:hypothetical protein